MKFTKYNEIENITNKVLYEFKESPLYNPKDIWVVTEKVHGSNLSIFKDDNGNIVAAKRTDILDTELSSFFNFQKIFDKYNFENLINTVENYVKYAAKDELLKEFTEVTIYGELCGGKYQDMPAIPNVKLVQKEIQYSNDTEFIIFDIKVTNSER